MEKNTSGRPKSATKMKQINSSVTADQYDYLKSHPGEGSAIVRAALVMYRAKEEFDNA